MYRNALVSVVLEALLYIMSFRLFWPSVVGGTPQLKAKLESMVQEIARLKQRAKREVTELRDR